MNTYIIELLVITFIRSSSYCKSSAGQRLFSNPSMMTVLLYAIYYQHPTLLHLFIFCLFFSDCVFYPLSITKPTFCSICYPLFLLCVIPTSIFFHLITSMIFFIFAFGSIVTCCYLLKLFLTLVFPLIFV